MQIPPHRFNTTSFSRAIKPSETNIAINDRPIASFDINNARTLTPNSANYGLVAQIANSKNLFEANRQKDIKRILKGRKLKELLSHDYSLEEFDELPVSFKNLIKFDRSITSAEILQFIEALDESHEITFRDYAFDRVKFRALFEALGDLLDIEMQAGPTTFVPLSEDFELKRKIKEIFIELKTKFRDRLKSTKKAEAWENIASSVDDYESNT